MVASRVSALLADEKIKSISPVEERLIAILKDGGPLTRDQLVKKFPVRRNGKQFARTTIYDGLKKLIVRGEVKKYRFHTAPRCGCPTYHFNQKAHVEGCPGKRPGRGRPQVLFSLLDDRK